MTARELAVAALARAETSDSYVQDELHSLMAAETLSSADKGLATEIALGTLRHRRTVDYLLRRLLRKPLQQLPPQVVLILESAAYQMLFLERVPDYAVVNEAVTMTRAGGNDHLSGLVNAVLRKFPTLLDRPEPPEEPPSAAVAGPTAAAAEPTDAAIDPTNAKIDSPSPPPAPAVSAPPAYEPRKRPPRRQAPSDKLALDADRDKQLDLDPRRLVPSPRGGAVVLRQALLPKDPLERLAEAYSFPDLIVKRWAARWGLKRAAEVFEYLNRPPRTFARVNTLRTTAKEILGRMPGDLRRAMQQLRPNVIDVTGLPHEKLLELLGLGLITVEDPTAMLAVEAMALKGGASPDLPKELSANIRPAKTVLDLCAAPGGKTSYIAEMMGGKGTIVALDRGSDRLELLRQTMKRLELDHVLVAPNEPRQWQDPRMPRQYDRVLVDVPCSNTGVLNRRVDARWRITRHYIAGFAEAQMALLTQAAEATTKGGLTLYSTCSLEPEENSELVRHFQMAHPWMALQIERETLPSAQGDGGYFARLLRIE